MPDKAKRHAVPKADKINKKNFTFPPQARLKNAREFAAVQAKAVKLHCRHFLILIAHSDKNTSRLGVTVSKKIDKRAVKRNKVKRRLREIFRLNRHLLRENFDIIIIARKNAAEIEFDDTKREILGTLNFKGYLKKSNDYL